MDAAVALEIRRDGRGADLLAVGELRHRLGVQAETAEVVAVAVVMTAFTAGAAAGVTGGFLQTVMTGASAMAQGTISLGAAFGAGVVGSLSSQVAGNITGNVDGISLKDALVSGVTTMAGMGVAKGLDKLAQAKGAIGAAMSQSWARGATAAVASNLTGYGANKLLGQDVSFSWRSVAASAVAGGISAEITPSLLKGLGINSAFGERLTAGLAGGVVSQHVRRSFGFDDPIDYRPVLADALTNAFIASDRRVTTQTELSASDGVLAIGGTGDGAIRTTLDVSMEADRVSAPNGTSATRATRYASSARGSDNDIRTLETINVTAVPDRYSANGWYFYAWNPARQSWVDAQRERGHIGGAFRKIPRVHHAA